MMSIRKIVWQLSMCAGITLSANAYAIALFQSESVASAAAQFEYHISWVRGEADDTEGTGRHSSHPSWNRSPNFLLPLAAGYFEMLPPFENFASPSTGLYLTLLRGDEAFGVNIAGFTNDEAGLVNMLALPDLFMQAQWQPEGNSQITPFTPHSNSGNVAPARNTPQVCAQLREVRRNRLEPRDGDCIGFGGGSDGSGNANRNGSRAGGDSNAIIARNKNARDSNAIDGAYIGGGGGGGGGGGPGGGRDAATPGTGGNGNGNGMFPPSSHNSDPDNGSESNPGGTEGGGFNQGNENGGTGEGSNGGGGTGGEDGSGGNGDTGNWNNPEEGEGPPPSEVTEVTFLPEPATLTLLAVGLAALCTVRRNQGKVAG